MKLRLLSSFFLTLLAAAASPAWAKDGAEAANGSKEIYAGIGFAPGDQPLHREIGLSIGAVPVYEGADDYGATGTPLINVSRPGVFFINGASINPNDGLLSAGLSLLHFGYKGATGSGVRVNLGPYVRLHAGRDEDDDDILNGLGDIDASAGLGLFLSMDAGQWRFHLAAAPHELDDATDDGQLVSLEVRYTTKLRDGWTLATGLAGSWANDEYTQGYFGVNTSQSAASGLALYSAESGTKDIGFFIHSTYAHSRDWLWHTQIGYWELQGDAADSPIVEAGSSGQLRALAGLSYRF